MFRVTKKFDKNSTFLDSPFTLYSWSLIRHFPILQDL